MGNSPAPTPPREWGLGAMGRWGARGPHFVGLGGNGECGDYPLTTNKQQPTTNQEQYLSN
ncbi:hypothetical protein [Fischerella muscicola]|uniref:hypothetical protein n=1 Tax=Fischerella muscicola TaxID=92938 RepID=UPI001F1E890F|nr:hypothetical protein [Fischerella muscicola]